MNTRSIKRRFLSEFEVQITQSPSSNLRFAAKVKRTSSRIWGKAFFIPKNFPFGVAMSYPLKPANTIGRLSRPNDLSLDVGLPIPTIAAKSSNVL